MTLHVLPAPAPPLRCRAEILRQYARHLGDAELLAVAHGTPGMAGRDLRDICEQAERRWASKVGGAAACGVLRSLLGPSSVASAEALMLCPLTLRLAR